MSDAQKNGNHPVNADGVLHVAFVLDRSGSMKAIEEAVVEGYNDYLGELRAQGGETLYSLTTFNTTFTHVCVGEPLDRVAALDHELYRPGGMTALYDAIAHTVLETDRRLQAEARGEREGAGRRDDGRARELVHGLRRGRGCGTGAPLRRAAELDVRLSRRRPREHPGRPAGGDADSATATRTRCSGRPTSSLRASRCSRSPRQPL